MKIGDKAITPQIAYINTKANVEAWPGAEEGMEAIATDTHEKGFYSGGSWIWGSGGSGGGAGSGPSVDSFWIDGALSIMDNAANAVLIASDITIESALVYIEYTGTAGTTMLDVLLKRHGVSDVSILYDGLIDHRPSIAFTEMDERVEVIPLITDFVAGDVLVMNILSVADGATSLVMAFSGGSSGGGITVETDPIFAASEAASFEAGDKTKLDGIEAGAEVNNISDSDADELTGGGETTLHTHPGGGGGGGITVETDPIFTASEAASFEAGDKTKLDGIETGAQVNNISDLDAAALTGGGETTLHTHPGGGGITVETDPIFTASEAASFEAGDKTKLDGIEAGAQVNNISDSDADELTGGGETSLHTHPGGGGGGIAYAIDMATGYDTPPTTPNAMDDEFNGTSIDAKWTQRNGNTPNCIWTPRADALWMYQPARSGFVLSTLMQAAPAGDFRVECAFDAVESLNLDPYHQPCGLLVSSAANTSSPVIGVELYLAYNMVWCYSASNYSAFASNNGSLGLRQMVSGYYAFERIGTTWNFYYSIYGRTWHLVATMSQPWPIVEIGLSVICDSGKGTGCAWKWFRRTA